MNINLNEMRIEEGSGLTLNDIQRDLKGSFKKIVIDGIHMADVLTDDYNQFQNVTGKIPDEVIREIYNNDLPKMRCAYPNRDDTDIVAFLFSEKLYKAIRRRYKVLQKE